MSLELAIISIIILIFSAILHEIAHGYVAERLGDPTARLLGRLTLNPIPHIDPVWSIIIPLLLILGGSPVVIGGAKPVPVDPFNLREPKKDMALVSLAGPLTNFLIAFTVAFVFKFIAPFINDPFLISIIYTIVQLNLLLGIFNLIPVPPLDGSKIFALFLPEEFSKTYLNIGNLGIFILFFLLMPFSPIPLGQILAQLLGFFMRMLGMYP
jgi:Zn-dependent protease